VVVNFIGVGNRSVRRTPTTRHHFVSSTPCWAGFEPPNIRHRLHK